MLSYRKGLKQIHNVDLFNKTDKSVLQRTTSGAIFTWLTVLVIVLLAFYEIVSFSTEDLTEVINIDNSGVDNMDVFLDIAFPETDCKNINLDILDQMGNPPSAAEQKIEYTPYIPEYPNTIFCKPCAQGEVLRCCECSNVVINLLSPFWQSLGHVLGCKAYNEPLSQNPGCRVTAILRIPKMKGATMIAFSYPQGNLHFAPGLNLGNYGGHSHQLNPYTYKQDLQSFKLTHEIFALSFGPSYPDMAHALKNYKQKHTGVVRQTYFLELVPTIYKEYYSYPLFTNQYSVTNHTEVMDLNRPLTQLPGLYFSFELSPMLISITRNSKSFLHLLTRLCAVVGGAWVVFGLLFSTLRSIFRLN